MRKIALLIIIVLFVGISCTAKEDLTLAKVGNEKITVQEFLSEYRPVTYPDETAELEGKKKVLEQIIDRKLMVAEAKSLGYDADTSLNEGKKQVFEKALVTALYNKEVIEKSKASGVEIKNFYNAENTILHLKVIQVNSDTVGAVLVRDMQSGVPFDTLAVRYSQHPSARNGGDIGKVSLARFYFDSEIYKALSKLKPGKTTKPLKSMFGSYEIYYLVDKSQPDKIQPLADRTEAIRRQIENGKERELRNSSLKKLLAESKIEYNEKAFSLLAKPSDSLSTADYSVWVSKVNGEVVDSVASLMSMYTQFSQGISRDMVQKAAEQRTLFPVLLYAARKRNLDKKKDVKNAVQQYVDSQIIGKLYTELIRDKVTVSDEEIDAYYNEHIKDFYVPERRNLSIIRTSSYGDIQQAYNQLRSGLSFEDVAKKFSDHQQSVDRGGSIGFRTIKDESFKPFVEQGFKLVKGQYSRPFEVYNGFGIVKIVDIQESFVREFEQEKYRIERIIRSEREGVLRESLLKKLRAKYPVDIDEKLLTEIGKVEENNLTK